MYSLCAHSSCGAATIVRPSCVLARFDCIVCMCCFCAAPDLCTYTMRDRRIYRLLIIYTILMHLDMIDLIREASFDSFVRDVFQARYRRLLFSAKKVDYVGLEWRIKKIHKTKSTHLVFAWLGCTYRTPTHTHPKTRQQLAKSCNTKTVCRREINEKLQSD